MNADQLNPEQDDVKKRLGKCISMARKVKNIKQEQLAETLGMCPSNLSRIETGYIDVNTTQLQKIACALGTTPSCLFSEAGL